MNRAGIWVLVAAWHAGIATAAVGEPGGAYGGGTHPQWQQESFQQVDQNRDGRISQKEARRAGLERFSQADTDHDGSLDRAEFAALQHGDAGMVTEPPTVNGSPQAR